MNNTSSIFRQLLSFLALVRVQNIILIIFAFFFTSRYIFVPNTTFKQLFLDKYFVLLLLSTTISIASGYIINSFYDYKKDLINRPKKTIIEQQLDQKKRLYLYFSLNFLAVALAWFISFRSAVFFSVFIFLIWIYSHKIKSYLFIGNLISSFLSILPFFAIFLFFKRINWFIFWHAVFLFLVLLLKDLIKNYVNLKGDMIEGNQTIPIIYGESYGKKIIVGVSLLLSAPIYILIHNKMIGNMQYYFYIFILFYFTGLLLFTATKNQEKYRIFYLMIKLLLGFGVFSIALVNR